MWRGELKLVGCYYGVSVNPDHSIQDPILEYCAVQPMDSHLWIINYYLTETIHMRFSAPQLVKPGTDKKKAYDTALLSGIKYLKMRGGFFAARWRNNSGISGYLLLDTSTSSKLLLCQELISFTTVLLMLESDDSLPE